MYVTVEQGEHYSNYYYGKPLLKYKNPERDHFENLKPSLVLLTILRTLQCGVLRDHRALHNALYSP